MCLLAFFRKETVNSGFLWAGRLKIDSLEREGDFLFTALFLLLRPVHSPVREAVEPGS